MALEKRKDARHAAGEANNEHPRGAYEPGMAQKRRWLVFGSNVVVAVLLATALLVGAIWLSDALLRGRGRSDWTATGRFSLSPRTKALLADLKEDLILTNLYTYSPEIPESGEQYQRVQDLLTEYGAANASRVTVEAVNPLTDAGGTEKLVTRLRQRYAKDLEKPKALVDEFNTLNKDLGDFLDKEAKQLEAAANAWRGGPPEAVQSLRTIAQKWRQLQMVGEFTRTTIEAATEQPLPSYSSVINRAKDYAAPVSETFGAVQEFFDKVQAAQGADAPPEVKDLLTSGKARYAQMRKRLDDFLKKAEEIKESEFDNVRREISQGQVVLIEAPDKVKVVGYEDVWVRNPEADEKHPDVPERLFAGESAVSSTLLGLVEPERPAVLFVTAGAPATMSMGNPMMGMGGGGLYARMAERLRKINFIVEDWDVLRSPEMPKPEHMTKAILVFVPPAPPSAQMPTPPPTPELYRAAIDAAKAGAPSIVMGEPASMMSPGVPYGELFGLFGITPKFNAVSVHRQVVDQQGTEKAVPQVEFTTYPDHPITRALNGLPAIMLGPSPLLVNNPLPEGVTATPLLLLPAEADYWADTSPMDVMRGEAKRDEAEDIFSTRDKPVPLAVACTRKLKEGEQKAVLFGDSKWAADRVAFYRDAFGRDMFPGNAELLVNSVLWVAGTEHLITVSPETLEARRIGDPGAWTVPVQVLTWIGIPALALAAGIIVYAVRRR